MSERIRTIRLDGKLAAKFGPVHRLAVANSAEAIRAPSVLLPGFRAELTTGKKRGIACAAFIGKRNITEEELCHPIGKEDIRIAPILQGSMRGGLLQSIFGAALVAVAVWNPAVPGLTSAWAWRALPWRSAASSSC